MKDVVMAIALLFLLIFSLSVRADCGVGRNDMAGCAEACQPRLMSRLSKADGCVCEETK